MYNMFMTITYMYMYVPAGTCVRALRGRVRCTAQYGGGSSQLYGLKRTVR
jgi:hypothetical protein